MLVAQEQRANPVIEQLKLHSSPKGRQRNSNHCTLEPSLSDLGKLEHRLLGMVQIFKVQHPGLWEVGGALALVTPTFNFTYASYPSRIVETFLKSQISAQHSHL
jgi:hypothetical protein